jgi:DNA-binding transcriptional regulator YiaG
MATTLNKRKRERKRPTNLYHYVEAGLTNVYLDGGVVIEDSPYGEAVSIVDVDGLHRCIAQCLIEKPGRLTGAEFRFLRVELDLSQRMIGDLCGRKERIVREWENKNAEVPDPANRLIRVIYSERFDPSTTYEGLSNMIAQLQLIDKSYFEMRLTPTKDGWCTKAA